ncbi:hypothetical protein SAMN04488121_106149 [Chitinophaga filiformis]|uniref:Uncharacterized protein n=1 Tax=Chitinophaga filiformis TaxID=104663 RepID=A0A1G7WTH4_CHIFI|nr:hypothetical protein SAMN04488121_106149 [Chitinophaga filiformis]
MQTYRFFLQLTKDIGNYRSLQVKQFTATCALIL